MLTYRWIHIKVQLLSPTVFRRVMVNMLEISQVNLGPEVLYTHAKRTPYLIGHPDLWSPQSGHWLSEMWSLQLYQNGFSERLFHESPVLSDPPVICGERGLHFPNKALTDPSDYMTSHQMLLYLILYKINERKWESDKQRWREKGKEGRKNKERLLNTYNGKYCRAVQNFTLKHSKICDHLPFLSY